MLGQMSPRIHGPCVWSYTYQAGSISAGCRHRLPRFLSLGHCNIAIRLDPRLYIQFASLRTRCATVTSKTAGGVPTGQASPSAPWHHQSALYRL
ncbi:hypothetical protein LZ31DRAFT_100083 [Colletotrichum somersetense]|nr:hypothetical protein LZ31DRAFT_100083 [Colletotrichum somersetense]